MIEPAGLAALMPRVGGPSLLPLRLRAAGRPAVRLAPVAGSADEEHRPAPRPAAPKRVPPYGRGHRAGPGAPGLREGRGGGVQGARPCVDGSRPAGRLDGESSPAQERTYPREVRDGLPPSRMGGARNAATGPESRMAACSTKASVAGRGSSSIRRHAKPMPSEWPAPSLSPKRSSPGVLRGGHALGIRQCGR